MSTLLGSNTVVTLRHWVCVIVETKAKLLFALYDEGQKCSQFVCAVQVCLLCYWELPLFCSISNWNCRILTPRTPSRPPRPSASTDHTWPGESQSCNHLDRCTRLMVSPLVKKETFNHCRNREIDLTSFVKRPSSTIAAPILRNSLSGWKEIWFWKTKWHEMEHDKETWLEHL